MTVHIKRIFTLLLLLTISLTALTACGEDEEEIPAGMQIGVMTAEYTFYIPQGWILQPTINGVALAYATETDKSSISIYAADMPAMSIDEYWQSSLDDFSRYESFTAESTNATVSFGTSDARQYVFTFKRDGVGYKCCQCLVQSGSRVYTMTYLAMTDVKPGSELSYYDYNFDYAEKARTGFRIIENAVTPEAPKTPFEDKSAPEGMMLISDTSIVDYKLYVPTDWKIDMQAGYTSAYVSESDRASVGVGYCTPMNGERTVEEYHATLAKKYAAVYKDYTELGEPEKVGEGDLQFLIYRYSATYAGRQITVLQAFAFPEGSYDIYTITYTAPSESFDTHLDTVNNIIKEFRFK